MITTIFKYLGVISLCSSLFVYIFVNMMYASKLRAQIVCGSVLKVFAEEDLSLNHNRKVHRILATWKRNYFQSVVLSVSSTILLCLMYYVVSLTLNVILFMCIHLILNMICIFTIKYQATKHNILAEAGN